MNAIAVTYMTREPGKKFAEICEWPSFFGGSLVYSGDRQRKNYPLKNGGWLQVFLVPVPLFQHPVFPFLPFALHRDNRYERACGNSLM